MRLDLRDAVAALLMAAIIAPYAGLLVRGQAPYIDDVRTMAAVAPDPARPDLLARIHLGQEIARDPEAVRMAAAITRRHSDRRAFGDRPVTDFELTKLRRPPEPAHR